MPKSYIYGNGNLAVGLDDFGQLYDLYYPYVGLENHTLGGYTHKIGVWAENEFYWLSDPSWSFEYVKNESHGYEKVLVATNSKLQVKVEFNDEVYNEKNIFLRQFNIHNLKDYDREIRIFFNQQFEIYESPRGDTAYFYPDNNTIVHYKGRRIFLVNAYCKEYKKSFDEYSVGLLGIEGKEGTYKDAEDGKLQNNPIEHGLVDSVLGMYIEIKAGSSTEVNYWICVGKMMQEVVDLNNYILEKTVSYLIRTTKDYWQAWQSKRDFNFQDLSEEEISLFYKSLKVMRLQSDNRGGVIASLDSDILKYGRDGYSYVWPRDAAFTSIAFSRAGYTDLNQTIFEFFEERLTDSGYLMHKYRSDRSLGASWHPWIFNGKKELPIQFDETALIVVAIWEDFQITRDIEFIERIYNSMIVKMIDFLISKIDKDTGIVGPSYDLWEETFASSTFTSCTVYSALIAAAKFAEILGKGDKASEYSKTAEFVRSAIVNNHYSSEKGIFYKALHFDEHNVKGNYQPNETLDMSSFYAIFKFGILQSDDEKVLSMSKNIEKKLSCGGEIGGYPRYENDRYFKVNETMQGNPWFITTFWKVQLEIKNCNTIEELQKCKQVIEWSSKFANKTGLLSEQLNPSTGEQVSTSPLTWSHAEYVVTVLDYIEKYKEILNSNNGN